MGSDRSPDRFSWERALLASDEFSATEQHVLLVLATHFGRRPATPGTRRLARLAHRNRETVMAALRHAEEAGWLVRGRRGRDGGGYVSTYQPLVPGDGPSLGTASAENGPSSGTASHQRTVPPEDENGPSRGQKRSLPRDQNTAEHEEHHPARADAEELLRLLGQDSRPNKTLVAATGEARQRGWSPKALAADPDVSGSLADARNVSALLAHRVREAIGRKPSPADVRAPAQQREAATHAFLARQEEAARTAAPPPDDLRRRWSRP